MIQLPLGFLLITGLVDAEPLMRVLIMLADLSLLALFINAFRRKTKASLITEVVSYVLLLLPLIKIFTSFPFAMFNYFLFLFPSACFIGGYPLSVLLSYRQFKKMV